MKTDEEATRHKSFIGDCNWLAQTTDPMLAPYVSIIGIKESKTTKLKKMALLRHGDRGKVHPYSSGRLDGGAAYSAGGLVAN